MALYICENFLIAKNISKIFFQIHDMTYIFLGGCPWNGSNKQFRIAASIKTIWEIISIE